MSSTPFVSALAGAIFGGMVTFLVNIIKARLDVYSARCEDWCKQIYSAADLASEYWLLSVDQSEGAGKDKDTRDQLAKARLLEARIRGLQEQVLLAHSDLKSELPREIRSSIDLVMPVFVDGLSGSEFLARSGNARPDRAHLVQFMAAQLISKIKKGLRAKYSLRYLAMRAFRRH